MVEFKKFSKSDFEEYKKEAIPKVAKEYIRAKIFEEKDSLKATESIFKEALPKGINTKGHNLENILYNGEKIGVIWYGPRKEGEMFIYDFIIYEPYQGKGFGKKTMQLLEERIKEMGIKKITLHVFGHNKIARSLYEKMGYEPFSIHMAKEI